MPKAYILALIDVPDRAAYAASGYMAMAEASVSRHGGRFLVRGGNPLPLEGEPLGTRTVIIEFPSRADAEAFHASPEYAPAIRLRQSLAMGSLTLLDGYEPA